MTIILVIAAALAGIMLGFGLGTLWVLSKVAP